MGLYEIFEDEIGEWRFRLKARNGRIIAVSEGYKRRRNAINGIESIKRNVSSPIIIVKK